MWKECPSGILCNAYRKYLGGPSVFPLSVSLNMPSPSVWSSEDVEVTQEMFRDMGFSTRSVMDESQRHHTCKAPRFMNGWKNETTQEPAGMLLVAMKRTKAPVSGVGCWQNGKPEGSEQLYRFRTSAIQKGRLGTDV